jgi:hypothetical protein
LTRIVFLVRSGIIELNVFARIKIVDHRKIALNPNDLKKLEALLRTEEKVVEAMSDAELDAAEQALEQRIRELPQLGDGVGPRDEELIQAGWQKLQKQLSPSTREELNTQGMGQVVALKPKKTMPWTTLGFLAAAALALVVFYPALRQGPGSDPTDFGQTQTKGVDSQGQFTYSAFCDVDVRGPNADSVAEAGAGQGYEIDPQAVFSISVSCDKAGYIQVWSKGSPAEEVRDAPVPTHVRTFVVEDGKTAEFTLGASREIRLELALTDKAIGSSADLFETSASPSRIGDASVLWADSIAVREKR